MPVGQMGTVKYVLTSIPTTTANYIQVDFNVSARGGEGEVAGAGRDTSRLRSHPAGDSWLGWDCGG